MQFMKNIMSLQRTNNLTKPNFCVIMPIEIKKCNIFGLLCRKLEAHDLERMCAFFVFKKKWKLNLYYNGMKIKTIKISSDEAPADNVYFIKVFGKKNLFGSNYVELAVKPKVLLQTNDKIKQTYWGVIFEKGVNVE